MHASEYFDLMNQSKVDEYQLLPVLWQVMVPEDKSKVLSVFRSRDCMWTPSFVMDLKNNFHLTLQGVALLQVCIWIALDHPSNIERGMEDVEITFPDVVAVVEKERKLAVYDISMWQLKPPGIKVKNIFVHMIGRRHVKYADVKIIKKHKISDDLNKIYP